VATSVRYCGASRLRRHHDAPLIGERAATRGRSATEGGDEPAGETLRVIPPNVPYRKARGERRDQGRARSSMTCGATWDDVHAGASVAGNDAPPIEATRRNGRPHHNGMFAVAPANIPHRQAAAKRRDRDAHARLRAPNVEGMTASAEGPAGKAALPAGPDERFRSAPACLRRPPRCAAHQRPRRNGRAKWKVAMSTPKCPAEARTPTFHAATPAANDATRDAHARRRASTPLGIVRRVAP